MKVNVYDIAGQVKKQITLPKAFDTEIRPRLITRAYVSSLTKKIQPKGTYIDAGRNTSALYVGKRRIRDSLIAVGEARKPRTKNARNLVQGRVAGIPGVVGGPKAHPPKVETVIAEKINKKERKLALACALAATTNRELVFGKGHIVDEKMTLPIIIEDKVEGIRKTKDIYNILESLKIEQDVETAKKKKTMRAGKGKKRGRIYRRKKSILFVVSDDKAKAIKGVRNLEGVDVSTVKNLSVEKLAPGGKAGRLVIFTESAVNALAKNE